MQYTEKYYETDAYRREAAGRIIAAEPDAKTGGGRIALDGTVFYPEGGGQPADRGTPDPCGRHGAGCHRRPRAGRRHLAQRCFPARSRRARGGSPAGP